MGGLKQADQNLARFHLSPKRQGNADRRQVSDEFSSKKRFFENICDQSSAKPFNEASVFSVKKESRAKSTQSVQEQDLEPDQLLAKMAVKQAKLADLQEQQKLLEFEILEIQAQLQQSFPVERSPPRRQENGALPDLSGLRKTTSMFFDHGTTEIRKTVSTLFQPNKSPVRADLRHQASTFFAKNLRPPELKNKASMMLNSTLSEVREKFDQQQSELETITRKGADFAREFLTSLSPKKANAAESSFIVENVCSGHEPSILLSEDESFDDGNAVLASLGTEPLISECGVSEFSGSSLIDIDDYESSDEN